MNVTFTRNGTQHHVTPQVAGELMTNMVAALCDARDGVDLTKSPSYLKFQSLMSEHVYRQRAAVKDVETAKAMPGARQGGKSVLSSQGVRWWFNESMNPRPASFQDVQEAFALASASIHKDQVRESADPIRKMGRVFDCRRAYNSMILNMKPYAAMIRLSERYGVPTETIREWVL